MAAATAATPNRILLVDNQPAVLDALEGLLAPARGIEVVARLPSADDLVQTVVRTRPDMIVLDLDMPGRSALAAVQDLRYRGDPVRVVILSAFMKDWQVRGAFAYGALAYVHKDDAPDALFAALSCARERKRYLSPSIAAAHPDLAARYTRSDPG